MDQVKEKFWPTYKVIFTITKLVTKSLHQKNPQQLELEFKNKILPTQTNKQSKQSFSCKKVIH